jgi:hypothetical protein
MDIFALTGKNSAYDVTIPIIITDGTLNIAFISIKDNAKLSALVVRKASPTGVKNWIEQSQHPFVYSLHQNYPNPFNPTTTINFDLVKSGNVNLIVYDMLGRPVVTLVHGELKAGHHTVNFIASNLASGVYFYSLQAGDFSSVKKLILLK